MTEQTPTTEQVRLDYVMAYSDRESLQLLAEKDFDAWLSAAVRKAKVEALREAAKDLQINTWMDLFEGPLQQRIASSQSVVEWLRTSADQIEAVTDD